MRGILSEPLELVNSRKLSAFQGKRESSFYVPNRIFIFHFTIEFSCNGLEDRDHSSYRRKNTKDDKGNNIYLKIFPSFIFVYS